jgi:hypothetical protein
MLKTILKKIAIKHTEKAFTIMNNYQPKMPKILRDKIASERDK